MEIDHDSVCHFSDPLACQNVLCIIFFEGLFPQCITSFIISSGLHYTVCTVLYMQSIRYVKENSIRLSLCGQPTAAYQISINPKHNKMFIQQLSFICGPGLGKYEYQFIYLSLFSRWLSGNQNKAAHKNKAAICVCSEPVSNQEHFQINTAF